MFYVAICDDEEVLCTQLEGYLEPYMDNGVIKVEVFYSSETLCEALSNGTHFDLIFLDIEFRKKDGVDAGKIIRNELKNDKVQIVYISAKREYAMELFVIRPMNFLIKPISKEEVIENLNKAMELCAKNNKCFEFNIGLENHKVSFGNIIYFESDNRKVKIHTVNGTREMYGKLKSIEKDIPADFIRIHQSFLVNRLYITYWKADELILRDTILLPISQAYRKKVNRTLLQSEE